MIIAAQNDPKGDSDISHLVQQEAALKQRLYEHYEDWCEQHENS